MNQPGDVFSGKPVKYRFYCMSMLKRGVHQIISRYNSDHNNPASQQCYGTEEGSY